MAHIPSLVTNAGAELPSPGSLLPVLQAVQSCTQRAQLIFQCSHSPVGEFSWIVSSTETTAAKFWGSGCLLESATSHWHWNKDSFSQGEFKGRQVKKKRGLYETCLFFGEPKHFPFGTKC